jgi:hypothetical protein
MKGFEDAVRLLKIAPAGHPSIAYHHNHILTHQKGFNEISQDEFKRKTDKFIFCYNILQFAISIPFMFLEKKYDER